MFVLIAWFFDGTVRYYGPFSDRAAAGAFDRRYVANLPYRSGDTSIQPLVSPGG